MATLGGPPDTLLRSGGEKTDELPTLPQSLDETRIIDDARGSRDHRTGGALERPLEDERFDLMESLDAGGLGDIGG